MADTINIEVTTTWTAFPASTDFLIQNLSTDRDVRIIISATTPGATLLGYKLFPGETATRLGPGNHWHRVHGGTARISFTDNDV